MESIIQQVKDLYAQADAKGRTAIQRDIDQLQGYLYSEMESMIHLAANVPVKYAMTLIEVGLHIFEVLERSDVPMTASQLAARVAAAPELLNQTLRTQAALDLVDQTGANLFQPNRLTIHDSRQSELEIPAAVPEAFKTNLIFADFLKNHPENLENLHKSMQHTYGNQWTDRFPEEVGRFDRQGNERPLLVDIGSGRGQQASAFKRRFPSLPGRDIVQDREGMIESADEIDRIEFMVHDFFQIQSTKSKFYHLRFVLHDWPDDRCVKILQGVVPAMGLQSRLILDEIVPQVLRVSRWPTAVDTAMPAAYGGSERSAEGWATLLDRVGVRMLELLEYDPQNLSVIVAVP